MNNYFRCVKLLTYAFGIKIVFFIALILTVSSGIITAGILTSLYRVITAQYPGFSMINAQNVLMAMSTTMLLVFCGPVVLVRNAYLGMMRFGYPWFAFALSLLIATYWSYITGMIILSTILSLIL